ncbi:MAG: hypothetical protein K9M15_01660, partial [Candidatus Marinimicrobia bacterium]|nr:hypothetical protein [Candidatus Neomarinimicrobiota bacterium]
MPYLYIRGRQDPIEISDKDAKVIKNALDKKMPFSTIIPLVNSSWKLSEVKGVVFEKPTVNQKRQTDDNEYMERLRRIDFDYRKNFINNLTNKDKAQEYIYHFKLFYQNYTGCLPTI